MFLVTIKISIEIERDAVTESSNIQESSMEEADNTAKVEEVNGNHYSNALTSDERKEIEEMAIRFYKDFPYDIFTIRIAKEDNFLYTNDPNYTEGNIIVFEVKTSQAGMVEFASRLMLLYNKKGFAISIIAGLLV